MILKFAVDVVHRGVQLYGYTLATVKSVDVEFWLIAKVHPAVRVTLRHDMGMYSYTQSYSQFCHAV